MIPKGLITKANKIVDNNFQNGNYYMGCFENCNYFVCLEGCGRTDPNERIAYIYKGKDGGKDWERLTRNCVQRIRRTFCGKDFKKEEQKWKQS